jgi:hypothetical protein
MLASLQIGDSSRPPRTQQLVKELLTDGWLALIFGGQPGYVGEGL